MQLFMFILLISYAPDAESSKQIQEVKVYLNSDKLLKAYKKLEEDEKKTPTILRAGFDCRVLGFDIPALTPQLDCKIDVRKILVQEVTETKLMPEANRAEIIK